MRKVTKKWTRRNGTKVRMHDGHLINTIYMLRRLHEKILMAAYGFESTCNGEGAQDAIAWEIRGLESRQSDHPLYDDLIMEAERRNLVIENCHEPV